MRFKKEPVTERERKRAEREGNRRKESECLCETEVGEGKENLWNDSRVRFFVKTVWDLLLIENTSRLTGDVLVLFNKKKDKYSLRIFLANKWPYLYYPIHIFNKIFIQ